MNIRILLTFLITLFSIGTLRASDAEDRHLELQEVVVRPGKGKYSKKNNPAVDFVRRVMAKRNLTDPRLTHDFYNHGQYERINLGLINFRADSAGVMSFLREYVDTTELSGRPVLNLSVKEKVSDHHFRRDPQTHREVVRLRNRNGLDDLLGDAASVQAIFEDVLAPVDLYDSDDITLLKQKFVSPLGRLAPDFYKFYLSDTIADPEHGDSLVVLSFLPHNPVMPSFNGRIYVVKGDTTMFIRRAEMRMPQQSNVNFISDMYLLQEYDRAPDGSRLKSRDEVIIEAAYLGVNIYFTRLTANNSHSFTAPRDSTVFSHGAEVIERNDLDKSIVSYRPADTQHGAANMDGMIARLRGNKFYYWTERTLSALVSDYVRPGGKQAPVAIGPIFSALNHNGLEGWRVRLGGMTTANLSPRVFLSGYGAYGFKDKKWKYSGSLEYSFINKKDHPGEFPVRSLRLTHTYDVDRLGQHYSSSGTLFNSLARTSNDLMTYNRETSLQFTYETASHLALSLRLSHSRQESSPYVEFVDGTGRRFSHFRQTAAEIELRYAPGEVFYQSVNRRLPIVSEHPVFRLTHTYAPAGILGTRWGVNKTEMSVTKRWYLSVWGHVDSHLGAGHLWGKSVFPSLLMPNANLSYFYQPRAFSLLNPMEFVSDSYVELHLNYDANGALLNYIPLINRLHLRELIGFHTIWGHLSDRNNPALHPDLLRFPAAAGTKSMGSTPYMEITAGLGNILRILSVQYVCRLTHNGPGLPHHGVRFAFNFSF